ncbi:uncharacterized protein LOC111708158 [Eurytemora carolleeae]|uniref:uncharacterized protein LOC111708158 n=1 Tax=Eurytemora carolleeae TaxID=1294199 RepID=UPI000C76B411|nr:uncharacterized protein LOC111708158 [Eurytemora carolleeae]|eukprot:XP_023337216.1 uncharacterized protein LOC111708158 [Eurytemora affinis]
MIVLGCAGVNPANILMYIPASSRSHVSAWEPLARGLARSGHHLTFVSSYKLQPEVNFTQILVKSKALKEIDEDFRSILLASDSVLGHIWKLLRMIYLFPDRMAEIHDEALTEMKYVLNKKWDLVIANPFLNEVGIILGDHFQVPTIHFLPANAEQFLSFSLGHPDNPAWSHPSADSLVSRSVVLLINI